MTSLRAALAVLVLAGFYVVALAILVTMAVLGVLALQAGEQRNGIILSLAAVVYAVAMVDAFRRARRRTRGTDGLEVSRDEAPDLWALVDELAHVAQTRAPDEIRLVGVVNAGVSEDARLLGLLPGRRRLLLGVPLVLGLDVSGLRAVLAHELGHYSHRHTGFAAVAYRGRVTVVRATMTLAEGGDPVGWVLKQYARFFLTVSSAVARRQELEADALAVRLAGREAAQGALREMGVLNASWAFYREAYLWPGWSEGVIPERAQVLLGFRDLLAARHDELARVREEEPSREQGRWDTHPSHGARIAAMAQVPDDARDHDGRPAAVLLPGLHAAAEALADDVLDVGTRRAVPWDELVQTAAVAPAQRSADAVYRAAARLARHERATLGTVLGLVEQLRGGELLAALGGEAFTEEDGGVDAALAGRVGVLLVPALVAAGSARWRHSWSGPATLVHADGAEVDPGDLRELAALAARPDGVAEARERLARLGVDVEAVGQVGDAPTAHGARVLGGIGDVEVDGVLHDVVLLDRGLLLVPEPARRRTVEERLGELLESAPVHVLADSHRFLPYEAVRSAAVLRRTPTHVDLMLADGRTVTLRVRWSSGKLTKESEEVLLEIADELAARGQREPSRV